MRPIFGAGHTINQATRVIAPRWPCEDPVSLVSVVTKDVSGTIYPARPLRPYAPRLWQRICAAYLVLCGRAAAVRWLAPD